MQHYLGLATGVEYEITKPVAISWARTYIEDDVDLIQKSETRS